MQAEVNGQVIELSEAGWLLNLEEWSEELAAQIAVTEKVPELTEEHWDIINEAREYFTDNGKVAEPRAFSKLMKKKYGKVVLANPDVLQPERNIPSYYCHSHR